MACPSIFSTLVILYIITAIYHLHKSSNPIEPCVIHQSTAAGKNSINDHHCLQPLLFAGIHGETITHKNDSDEAKDKHDNQYNTVSASKSSSHLLLELYVPSLVLRHVEMTQGNGKKSRHKPQMKMEWRLVSSCSSLSTPKSTTDTKYDNKNSVSSSGNSNSTATMTFPDFRHQNRDNYSSLFTTTTKSRPSIKTQCELSIPNFIRKRTKNPKTMKILQGKLILKRIIISDDDSVDSSPQQTQHEVIIAETLFDLTRIINQSQNEEFASYYKYYKQALVLRVVTDTELYPVHNPVRGDGYGMIIDDTSNHIINYKNDNNDQSPSHQHYYRPLFYVDDIALRHSSQVELASQDTGKPPVKLIIKISFITPFRDVVQRQLSLSMKMAEQLLRQNELDEIRYMISDEYMYKFILTQIIGLIHLSLDYLAFKNEIGFYVGRGKDVTGISLSSIYSRSACDVIIFLYLIEGGNTSWFVLFGIALSIGVELWKLIKFLQPKVNIKRFPFVSFRDLSQLNSAEQLTVDYDGIARTYLSLVLYPLVLGLALYGRQFYAYKSWYSWTISNLANAVYTFGFICLCPQLYINYRLKSVAHMPWKVFVYKIFNTFIDDVFAFLIEMPMKHKIMTLRDDVVFLIFLIQAYIYRVDKTRANEFGYAYEMGETKENLIEQKQADRVHADAKHDKLE